MSALRVAHTPHRPAAVPPPAPSGTRLAIAGMVPGAGPRHHQCAAYSACLGRAARNDGDAHCPPHCPEREDVRVADALEVAHHYVTAGAGPSGLALLGEPEDACPRCDGPTLAGRTCPTCERTRSAARRAAAAAVKEKL